MYFEVVSYFVRLSIFSGGLIGAIQLFLFFFTFVYISYRWKDNDPLGLTTKILIPPILLSFFMYAAGFNDLIIGSMLLPAFLISVWHYDNLKKREWIISSIRILLMFFIFACVDLFTRNILFLLYLGIIFVLGEKKIRDKKDEENEKMNKD